MLVLTPMRVRTRQPRSTPRARVARNPRRMGLDPQLRVVPSEQPASAPHTMERNAGGPQDHAAYHCACGCVFEAPVSTTVGCPHCGGEQAW
jgi:hypothetical protein